MLAFGNAQMRAACTSPDVEGHGWAPHLGAVHGMRCWERCGRRRGWLFVAGGLRPPHLCGGHKAIAAAAYCLDDLRRLATVVESATCRSNAALQRIVADKLPGPQALD
jgi:hypothetical protein